VSGTAVLSVESAGAHVRYGWPTSLDGGRTPTEILSTTGTKGPVTAWRTPTTAPSGSPTLTPRGPGDRSQPMSVLVKW